jgi:hypothetical protein
MNYRVVEESVGQIPTILKETRFFMGVLAKVGWNGRAYEDALQDVCGIKEQGCRWKMLDARTSRANLTRERPGCWQPSAAIIGASLHSSGATVSSAEN